MRMPTEQSKRLLGSLVAQSNRSVVPLDVRFVRRMDPTLSPPPLAELLRGGRGGEVRLKLFLSMQLIAVKAPHDIKMRPAYSWASLLSLPDPHVNGARRVNDAIRWLEAHKLIRVERAPGAVPEVFLLSNLGTGEPYTRPTDNWVNMPVSFWLNGWIVTLSASALAMWLITRDMAGGRTSTPQWISPAEAQARYDLSDDTRTKGTRELADHGLVVIGKTTQGETYSWDRLRNTYLLDFGRLEEEPGSEPSGSEPPQASRRRPRTRRREAGRSA